MTYSIGQQVAVIDGGWTGFIENIDHGQQTAYVRFPDCPELRPYAFEALSLSDYERAAERFERISRSIEDIRRLAYDVIQWAEDEYSAAQDNLRLYEQSPGIPLPQYRQNAEV